jgi:hypothetical protein
MRTGFVIEFNVRGEDGRVYPNEVFTSKQFGQEAFDDLTDDDTSVFVQRNLDGVNSEHDEPVIYDRCFVVIS